MIQCYRPSFTRADPARIEIFTLSGIFKSLFTYRSLLKLSTMGIPLESSYEPGTTRLPAKKVVLHDVIAALIIKIIIAVYCTQTNFHLNIISNKF